MAVSMGRIGRVAGATFKKIVDQSRTMYSARNPLNPVALENPLHLASLRCYSLQPDVALRYPAEAHQTGTTCTMIPGDGVGPELMASVKEVFRAAGVPIVFEEFYFSEMNSSMSCSVDEIAKAIRRNVISLKGPLLTPSYSWDGESKSLDMKLRLKLGLFAHVARIKSLPGLKTRHQNIDFLLVREQTEGEHLALEHESAPGVVECLKIVTREKSKLIAKFAFEYALKYGRRKVTVVHKANIMKLGDGLFLKCCEEVSKLYPMIECNNIIIDNCTMQLVMRPHQFDVLVMPNLYGDILDNAAAGLVGGAGVVAGESYSSECVVFEPGARHAYYDAVGRDVANPTAMFLSATNMLRHVNMENYSVAIEKAMFKVLNDGKVRTKDMGGHSTNTAFTKAVIHNLDRYLLP
ncbi:Isocitrate dehydrogenase [NAD] subunit beta, mitochondrial [Chamberlinius hualienensis]